MKALKEATFGELIAGILLITGCILLAVDNSAGMTVIGIAAFVWFAS